MILSPNFIYRKIADEHFILPLGNKAVEFHNIITLNETAALIVDLLQADQSFEALVCALEKNYNTDRETAVEDVRKLIDLLTKNGIIQTNND